MDPLNILMVLFALFAGAAVLLAAGLGVAGYLLATELRLFLRAPAFYVEKLVGPPGPAKRARALGRSIRELLPPASSDPLLAEVGPRVDRTVKAIRDLERRRDEITLYLEYDVAAAGLGTRVDLQDRGALDILEQRRGEIDGNLEAALGGLQRIRDRVAAKVLAGRDTASEAELQLGLDESLEELDSLIEADQSVGLLPER